MRQGKFKEIFTAKHPEVAATVNPDEVDSFVKNSHHLRVLRGKQLAAFDKDQETIGKTARVFPPSVRCSSSFTQQTRS